MATLFLTKEARIYNGAKTGSSINGAGKTGQNDQAPPSMGFSRQEYWSGLPCPSPGDLPNPGIKPRSPALQADSIPAETQGKS